MNSRKEIKIQAFGCAMENSPKNDFQCSVVTFWKCYFPTNFSHFLSFQTNFILENPPPSTHQHSQKIHHYLHNTHHYTTQKPPQHHHPHHHNNNKKIRDQREKVNRRMAATRSKGDDMTQRRMGRSRGRWRLNLVQKSKLREGGGRESDCKLREREREIEKESDRSWVMGDETGQAVVGFMQCDLAGTISPARLGLGCDLAHSLYSLFLLFLSLWVFVSPKIIWR